MPRAHRRIVGEYPFTLLAADGDVAAGGELDHVTYAAVGAQLGEARDVGARDGAAHPVRGGGARGSGGRARLGPGRRRGLAASARTAGSRSRLSRRTSA